MADDALYHDPALAQFYDFDNHWGVDDQFCLSLARQAGSVLDLGCGTGRLATAIALQTGAQVTGVDPAGAMLAIAAAKPGGDKVRWIRADACDLALEARFDLVVLTGHAFQVFLDQSARSALLASIARHLTPQGRFIFDSRNPAAREWQDWTPEATRMRRDHPTLGPVDSWNDIEWDDSTAIATYQTHYRIVRTDETCTARSCIAFPTQSALAHDIALAGLVVGQWLGDWSGTPYTPAAPEIIPLGRLAPAP